MAVFGWEGCRLDEDERIREVGGGEVYWYLGTAWFSRVWYGVHLSLSSIRATEYLTYYQSRKAMV